MVAKSVGASLRAQPTQILKYVCNFKRQGNSSIEQKVETSFLQNLKVLLISFIIPLNVSLTCILFHTLYLLPPPPAA